MVSFTCCEFLCGYSGADPLLRYEYHDANLAFLEHSLNAEAARIIYLFTACECTPRCYGGIDRGVPDNAFSEPSLRDLDVITERSYEKSRRVLGEEEKCIPGREVDS